MKKILILVILGLCFSNTVLASDYQYFGKSNNNENLYIYVGRSGNILNIWLKTVYTKATEAEITGRTDNFIIDCSSQKGKMSESNDIYPDIVDKLKNPKLIEFESNMNEYYASQPLKYIEPDTDLMYFYKNYCKGTIK